MAIEEEKSKYSHFSSMVAGGVATLFMVGCVYPLDTLKTRLQSAQGFQKSGGFKNLYRGVLILATGSIPINCVFFGTYEAIKQNSATFIAPQYQPMVHMFAASFCRIVASLIRVPTEVAKQRKQILVGPTKETGFSILMDAYKKEGLINGVYRGFATTVMRDMPYSFIELPVWEMLKSGVRKKNNGHVTSIQSGVCGSMAGGFAAAVTTPLDVVKTRVMLAEASSSADYANLRIRAVLVNIYKQKGVKGLFAGLTPRVSMVMIRGFVFFFAYEETKRFFDSVSKR